GVVQRQGFPCAGTSLRAHPGRWAVGARGPTSFAADPRGSPARRGAAFRPALPTLVTGVRAGRGGATPWRGARRTVTGIRAPIGDRDGWCACRPGRLSSDGGPRLRGGRGAEGAGVTGRGRRGGPGRGCGGDFRERLRRGRSGGPPPVVGSGLRRGRSGGAPPVGGLTLVVGSGLRGAG